MSRNRGHWQECTPRGCAPLLPEPRVIALRGPVIGGALTLAIGGPLLVLLMALLP